MLTSSTPTPTPSATPIYCGQGVTNPNGFYYYYTDCCGNFIEGETPNFPILLDYSKPYNGIEILMVPDTTVCPTPSPTPTMTVTPTITNTPTNTPTQTITPTETPTNTPTPTPSSAFIFKNDCEVFTLFDMGLECYTIKNPTLPNSYDGELQIKVTGGTSPYSYFWSGGQRSPILYGIPEGDYEVTVVDFYGDYTSTTICKLVSIPVSPTPTQTSTPTPSVLPVCNDLCFTTIIDDVPFGPWQFICNGYHNERFRWTYNSLYNIVWNDGRWEICENDLETLVLFGNGVIVSNSQQNVPLSSWKYLGTAFSRPVISVIEDTCPPGIPMKSVVSFENTNCGLLTNCDGSIIFTTKYGNPPYQYSIDGGFTYQFGSIFNGLCAGTYTTKVKDSSNATITEVVTISSNQLPKSYVITVNNLGTTTTTPTLNESIQLSKFQINVSPQIPAGVQLSFDLEINYEINNMGPWAGNNPNVSLFNVEATVDKNNIDVVLNESVLPSVLINRPNCAPYKIERTTGVYTTNITMVSGDVISGVTYCNLEHTDPIVGPNGCVTTLESKINVSVSSLTITGEYCSELIKSNNNLIYTQKLVGSP